MIISTLLMMLIIVPVIALTLVFAWRYRESNTTAIYTPEWDHSIQLELLIWAAPLLIIIALGALTWIGTHTLDPYRSAEADRWRASSSTRREPLNIEVVALDWKWLFIYPDHDIAVVNELAAPVDVPIRFKITASSVMNSFFIPALAGQIYAMPSMDDQPARGDQSAGRIRRLLGQLQRRRLFRYAVQVSRNVHGRLRELGAESEGRRSALSRDDYLKLEKPSEREPVRRYQLRRARSVRRSRQSLRRARQDLPSRHDGDGRPPGGCAEARAQVDRAESGPRRGRMHCRCLRRRRSVGPGLSGLKAHVRARRLRELVFGRLSWSAIPYCTNRSCWRRFARSRDRRLGHDRRADLFPRLGPAMARLGHQHRSQEDRRDVRRSRAGDAAARFRRRRS